MEPRTITVEGLRTRVLVALALCLGAAAVAAGAVAAGRALRRGARWQARQQLLEVGGQRANPVEARFLLERLARVADELLRAGFFVDRQAVLELAEQLLDPVGE